ncbi:MAG: oligoribonuclease [Micrococcales bacterium]|jgi:oligoribonuclease|nr:oligoribonuclease [Micrococcales bacterium]MDG1817254.1 oligoribonuclease [Aquiluna sp.]MBT5432023.1 oligoribonuclease [Micrococcales bacterium]MBT5848045.1 oligoribonuclease [Micrococcales bacterium]MBT7925525.1 oligoribonuclease [Micrococcales bacterium]
MNDYIVWVDCEMTGLEIGVDEICEIAVIVTDQELKPVHEGLQLVVKPSRKAMKNMGEFVTQMHTDSGLIEEIPAGISIKKAEAQVLDYIKQWITEPRTAPLAGNSIGTDRMFLNRQTPEFDSFLHYRNIDVSSLKELARRWYPKVYFQLPKKQGDHRALADIRESIQELRYYREVLLVDQPGPTSKELKSAVKVLEADTI